MVTQTLACYHCASTNLIRFGHHNNKQRYRCKDCGKTSRENKGSAAYDATTKAQILAAYHERGSMRAMTRIFGVSRNTVLAWLKKAASLPLIKKTLVKAQNDDVLELDEMWLFVHHKKNRRWIWLAQCRRTRQIVAYAIGDRSRKTCALL
jgi:insertion element IS1 protein InsB